MNRRELIAVTIAIELTAAGAVFAAFLVTSTLIGPLERWAGGHVNRKRVPDPGMRVETGGRA